MGVDTCDFYPQICAFSTVILNDVEFIVQRSQSSSRIKMLSYVMWYEVIQHTGGRKSS